MVCCSEVGFGCDCSEDVERDHSCCGADCTPVWDEQTGKRYYNTLDDAIEAAWNECWSNRLGLTEGYENCDSPSDSNCCIDLVTPNGVVYSKCKSEVATEITAAWNASAKPVESASLADDWPSTGNTNIENDGVSSPVTISEGNCVSARQPSVTVLNNGVGLVAHETTEDPPRVTIKQFPTSTYKIFPNRALSYGRLQNVALWSTGSAHIYPYDEIPTDFIDKGSAYIAFLTGPLQHQYFSVQSTGSDATGEYIEFNAPAPASLELSHDFESSDDQYDVRFFLYRQGEDAEQGGTSEVPDKPGGLDGVAKASKSTVDDLLDLPAHVYNGIEVPSTNPSITCARNFRNLTENAQYVYVAYQAFEDNKWNIYLRQIRLSEYTSEPEDDSGAAFVSASASAGNDLIAKVVCKTDSSTAQGPNYLASRTIVLEILLQDGREIYNDGLSGYWANLCSGYESTAFPKEKVYLKFTHSVLVTQQPTEFRGIGEDVSSVLLYDDLFNNWQVGHEFFIPYWEPYLQVDAEYLYSVFRIQGDSAINPGPLTVPAVLKGASIVTSTVSHRWYADPDTTPWVVLSGSEFNDYSDFKGIVVGEPVLLTSNEVGHSTNPVISVNYSNEVYVVYETTTSGTQQINLVGTAEPASLVPIGEPSPPDPDEILGYSLGPDDFMFRRNITSASQGLNQMPDMYIDFNNVLHLTWQSNRDQRWEIYYTNSELGYATVRITEYDSRSLKPSICGDETGNTYIAWHDDRFSNWEIMLAYRLNDRILPLYQQDPYLASAHNPGYSHSIDLVPLILRNTDSERVCFTDVIVRFFEDRTLENLAFTIRQSDWPFAFDLTGLGASSANQSDQTWHDLSNWDCGEEQPYESPYSALASSASGLSQMTMYSGGEITKSEDPYVEFMFLIDYSGSMADKASTVQARILDYIDQITSGDPYNINLIDHPSNRIRFGLGYFGYPQYPFVPPEDPYSPGTLICEFTPDPYWSPYGTAGYDPSIFNYVPELDFMFVIDYSGSMQHEIDDVKLNAGILSERFSDAGIDARFGLVIMGTYGDYSGNGAGCPFAAVNEFAHLYGDAVTTNFTNDVDLLKDVIGHLSASGAYEPMFISVQYACESSDIEWRPDATKIIFGITDERHDQQPTGRDCGAFTNLYADALASLQSLGAYFITAITNDIESEGLYTSLSFQSGWEHGRYPVMGPYNAVFEHVSAEIRNIIWGVDPLPDGNWNCRIAPPTPSLLTAASYIDFSGVLPPQSTNCGCSFASDICYVRAQFDSARACPGQVGPDWDSVCIRALWDIMLPFYGETGDGCTWLVGDVPVDDEGEWRVQARLNDDPRSVNFSYGNKDILRDGEAETEMWHYINLTNVLEWKDPIPISEGYFYRLIDGDRIVLRNLERVCGVDFGFFIFPLWNDYVDVTLDYIDPFQETWISSFTFDALSPFRQYPNMYGSFTVNLRRAQGGLEWAPIPQPYEALDKYTYEPLYSSVSWVLKQKHNQFINVAWTTGRRKYILVITDEPHENQEWLEERSSIESERFPNDMVSALLSCRDANAQVIVATTDALAQSDWCEFSWHTGWHEGYLPLNGPYGSDQLMSCEEPYAITLPEEPYQWIHVPYPSPGPGPGPGPTPTPTPTPEDPYAENIDFIFMVDYSGSMVEDMPMIHNKIYELAKDLVGEGEDPYGGLLGPFNPHRNMQFGVVYFGYPRYPMYEQEADPYWEAPYNISYEGIDFVFAIDYSGSMGDDINSVKTSVPQLAHEFVSRGIDIRFGFVVFGRGGALNCPVNGLPGEPTGFTRDVTVLQAAMNGYSLSGGVEPLFSAVRYAVKDASLEWRPGAAKYVFVITDEDNDEKPVGCGGGSYENDFSDALDECLDSGTKVILAIHDFAADTYMPLSTGTGWTGDYYPVGGSYQVVFEQLSAAILQDAVFGTWLDYLRVLEFDCNLDLLPSGSTQCSQCDYCNVDFVYVTYPTITCEHDGHPRCEECAASYIKLVPFDTQDDAPEEYCRWHADLIEGILVDTGGEWEILVELNFTTRKLTFGVAHVCFILEWVRSLNGSSVEYSISQANIDNLCTYGGILSINHRIECYYGIPGTRACDQTVPISIQFVNLCAPDWVSSYTFDALTPFQSSDDLRGFTTNHHYVPDALKWIDPPDSHEQYTYEPLFSSVQWILNEDPYQPIFDWREDSEKYILAITDEPLANQEFLEAVCSCETDLPNRLAPTVDRCLSRGVKVIVAGTPQVARDYCPLSTGSGWTDGYLPLKGPYTREFLTQCPEEPYVYPTLPPGPTPPEPEVPSIEIAYEVPYEYPYVPPAPISEEPYMEAPVIAEIPDQVIFNDSAYSYTATLESGTTPVQWSLVSAPAGMTIGSSTGIISWPSPEGTVGSSYSIRVRAVNGSLISDITGGSDTEDFDLTVLCVREDEGDPYFYSSQPNCTAANVSFTVSQTCGTNDQAWSIGLTRDEALSWVRDHWTGYEEFSCLLMIWRDRQRIDFGMECNKVPAGPVLSVQSYDAELTNAQRNSLQAGAPIILTDCTVVCDNEVVGRTDVTIQMTGCS